MQISACDVSCGFNKSQEPRKRKRTRSGLSWKRATEYEKKIQPWLPTTRRCRSYHWCTGLTLRSRVL